MEVWKEIKDYEGLYWISNFGRIKSNKKVLSISNRNNSKYLQITLYKRGKRSTRGLCSVWRGTGFQGNCAIVYIEYLCNL